VADSLLLLRAAKLLEKEAEGLREACAGNDSDWQCGCTGKCQPQLHYDEMVRVIRELREAARGA
jgi:hypothetical protein